MTFKFNPDELKKGAATLKEQAEKKGGYRPEFKFKATESYLLVLQKDNNFIQEVAVHEVWKNNKPVAKVGSPSIEGLPDPIMDRGWEMKDKFKDHPNEDLQQLWRKYMPRRQSLAYVIDLKNIGEGVQMVSLPKMVKDFIVDEVSEVETEEQAKSIFDLDQGRILKVTHNGGQKINKKYEVVKFLDKRAGLVKAGKVDPVEIEKQMISLKKMQLAWDDARIQKVLQLLDADSKYLIEKAGADVSWSGVNTKAGQVLMVNCKAMNEAAIVGNDIATTMYTLLQAHQILEIRDLGCTVYDKH